MRFVQLVGAVSVVALGVVGGTGCTVHTRGYATTEPVGTTYVTSAPVESNYDAYPHTEYEGHTVYYVNNQWGYPNQGRFVAYRNEPAPLVRYRTNVREAPPAARPEARPEYRNEGPRPEEAPPAVRVR